MCGRQVNRTSECVWLDFVVTRTSAEVEEYPDADLGATT
jgi:hypothetical protein